MGVRDGAGAGAILRHPLMRAGGAARQLPVVAEQVFEEVVAPLRRRAGPGDLQPAGDRIGAHAGAVRAAPAQALLLDRGRLGLGADARCRTGAVRLAEGVAAGDERHGLLVVHGHAREGLPDVARRGDRIGVAVRALRVHVDQAHLGGRERTGELPVAAMALVAEPRALAAPVDVRLGLPDVGAAASEAEGPEAHGLERDRAGEDDQVRPGQLAAVLLLDRPEQATRLVEVAVVRPTVQRCEALGAVAAAAAAVGDAIGPRRMPRHADEQRAVVSEVRGPPVLRVRHQVLEVPGHGVQVEALEFLGVVERGPHGIRPLGLPVQDREVQRVGPPVMVGPRACRVLRVAPERASGVG